MSDIEKRKSGFWDRILGREAAPPTTPPEPERAPDPAASAYEGQPDFTTAAAAGDLPPVGPTATQASPDLPADGKRPAGLAGAAPQPVEGREPEGGAPKEPIPRAEPEPVAPAPTADAQAKNWWRRLAEGMRRTSS